MKFQKKALKPFYPLPFYPFLVFWKCRSVEVTLRFFQKCRSVEVTLRLGV